MRMESLPNDGFVVLRGVFTADDVQSMLVELERATSNVDPAIRRNGSAVYAVRDLLRVCPRVIEWWRKPRLVDLVRSTLGPDCGLVRGVLFDKPPQQTWAVPFHKDLTIAIAPPEQLSPRYSSPRLKAGVMHCEAPVTVLERMLTLRIHLDAATDETGALQIRPGTHRGGKMMSAEPVEPLTIIADAGDVLAMFPLVEHASGKSQAGNAHRRVLHLEFAATAHLPDGYRWHEFVRI